MDATIYFQYSFIAFICFCLLIQNYFNLRQYGNQTVSGRFLRLFILSMCLASAIDVFYGLREAGIIEVTDWFGYTEEILYFIVVIFGSYFWYIASESFQQSIMVRTRTNRILVSIPLFIMVGITLFTPIHHLNFYFEDGHYVRGPLTYVFTAVMAVFIVGTGFAALVNSLRKNFYIQRVYFRIIFLYAVALLLSQGFQLIVGTMMLPFRTIGATLVIYIIQQRYIKENIYVDPMTGANNRNAAEKYLGGLAENKQTNLQVSLIDLDGFKKINDNYGHQVGDLALKLLAESFQCHLKDGIFFARFGGDEFILIDKTANPEKLQQLIQNAKESLNQACEKNHLGFTMDFSYGIIQKTAEMDSIPELLEAADEAMYQNKREKKAAR